MKFETEQILFLGDVFAAVAVVLVYSENKFIMKARLKIETK